MTRGVRKKVLVAIKNALKARPYFKEIQTQLPKDAIPKAIKLPAAFMGRGIEDMEYLTNVEKRSEFRFVVIGYVMSDSELEIVKTEMEDHIEEALINLSEDNDFLNLAVMLTVDGADAGPLALAPLGYAGGIFPPFGAIRVDGTVTFDYSATG